MRLRLCTPTSSARGSLFTSSRFAARRGLDSAGDLEAPPPCPSPDRRVAYPRAATMILPIPIGVVDFRSLREQRLEYIDKSHLIRELLDRGAQVVLLPRPRRFGKTLNLSMLRYFFEKRDEDLTPLFADLSIWQAGDPYRAHFQRHPVIHLTFKGVKFEHYEPAWAAIRKKIQILFDEHRHVLEGDLLSEREARDYRAILDGATEPVLYHRALLDLSAYLHRLHGEKVVLLIDEYDEPIHAGYLHGYAAPMLEFCRAFLTESLKDNPHVFKAVLTGILRIARESIFSGLNNLAVYSLLRQEFSDCFGFTEAEVLSLLERAGRSDLLEPVRSWYNGYVFGGKTVYNPWSILNFIASDDKLLRGYWVSTSANDLVRDLLVHHALDVEADMAALLEGDAIERRVDENVVLTDLRDRPDALYDLLVFSGYLKAEAGSGVPGEEPAYRLSIPNREVREVYAGTFRRWMESQLDGHRGSLRKLTSALLEGDAELLEEQIQTFVINLLSYQDPAGVDPERVYHGFVVGLLAVMEPAYQVRSNRESGRGRPDVMIRPTQAGQPGVVLELKVAKPPRRTMEQVLEEGATQLQEKAYGAELRAAGATPVHAFVVAFDGKIVRVRRVDG